MTSHSISEKGLIIPLEKLSHDAFDGLIQEFILREGTDYGVRELTLGQKKERIIKQIKSGHIFVVFDLEKETTSILHKEQIPKNFF